MERLENCRSTKAAKHTFWRSINQPELGGFGGILNVAQNNPTEAGGTKPPEEILPLITLAGIRHNYRTAVTQNRLIQSVTNSFCHLVTNLFYIICNLPFHHNPYQGFST